MRAADGKGFRSNLKRKLCGKLNNRFSVSLLPVRRGSLSTRLSAAIPEDVHLTYSYPDHSRIITPTELIKHNAAHSVFSANPTSDTVAAINRDSAGKHYPLSLRSPRGAATTQHNFKAGK